MQRICRSTCAKKTKGGRLRRAIVPGKHQAKEMARAAIGKTWRTASELGVRAFATDAPIWADDLDDAWQELAKPSKRVAGGIVVESCFADGEKRYRASGTATPLPEGRALVAAIEQRLEFALCYLLNNCDGGTHPNGHTAEAIEAVPTIAAARAWLAAERRTMGRESAAASAAPAGAEPASDDAGDEWEASRERDPKRRKAIELRAMEEARRHYCEKGWNVEDVSAAESYDLCCRRGGDELHVEVKGVSADGSEVHLTRNEVEHAREYPRPVLFVVSGIEVSYADGGGPAASGGQARILDPWRIGDGELTALDYSYRLPADS